MAKKKRKIRCVRCLCSCTIITYSSSDGGMSPRFNVFYHLVNAACGSSPATGDTAAGSTCVEGSCGGDDDCSDIVLCRNSASPKVCKVVHSFAILFYRYSSNSRLTSVLGQNAIVPVLQCCSKKYK